jgi:hypothetical protein
MIADQAAVNAGFDFRRYVAPMPAKPRIIIAQTPRGTNARVLGWERSTSREISHAPLTRRALHLRLRPDGMCSDGAQPRSIKRISAHSLKS